MAKSKTMCRALADKMETINTELGIVLARVTMNDTKILDDDSAYLVAELGQEMTLKIEAIYNQMQRLIPNQRGMLI